MLRTNRSKSVDTLLSHRKNRSKSVDALRSNNRNETCNTTIVVNKVNDRNIALVETNTDFLHHANESNPNAYEVNNYISKKVTANDIVDHKPNRKGYFI